MPESKGSLIMLILTRRTGEKLVIGDNVVVTVLGVKGNQIRIGIEAPREVQVHREEIYKRILKERAEANATELSLTANTGVRVAPIF